MGYLEYTLKPGETQVGHFCAVFDDFAGKCPSCTLSNGSCQLSCKCQDRFGKYYDNDILLPDARTKTKRCILGQTNGESWCYDLETDWKHNFQRGRNPFELNYARK